MRCKHDDETLISINIVHEETAKLFNINNESNGETHSGKTEVLVVKMIDSLSPTLFGTLTSVYDVDNISQNHCHHRMLTVEQINSLIEQESIALEIDTLRREITFFSGKPFAIVYTYGKKALTKNVAILDKNKIPQVKYFLGHGYFTRTLKLPCQEDFF